METEKLTPGTKGAIGELRAAVYLMKRGFSVYRCESPHAPFDLVAYKDGTCHRVEVKTLSIHASSGAPEFSWPTNNEWDLLLLAGEDAVLEFPAGMTRDEVRDSASAYFGLTRQPAVHYSAEQIKEYQTRHQSGESWENIGHSVGKSSPAIATAVARRRHQEVSRRSNGRLANPTQIGSESLPLTT